jgi:lysophospholipase L1-like esterase
MRATARMLIAAQASAGDPGSLQCEGDSITVGYLLEDGDDYPTLMAPQIAGRFTLRNVAEGGSSVGGTPPNMTTGRAAKIDPYVTATGLFGFSSPVRNVVTLAGGTNDLGFGITADPGAHDAAYWGALVGGYILDYVADLVGLGVERIVVIDVLPRTFFDVDLDAEFEAARLAVMAHVKAGCDLVYQYGDNVSSLFTAYRAANAGAQPQIVYAETALHPSLADAGDTDFFFDGTHTSRAANVVRAAILAPVVNAAVGLA